MLGINGGEFVLLLVVALVVVGPERLPRYAEQLGIWVRTARRYALTAKERVTEELGEDVGDVDWAALDPRRIVREALLDDTPAPAAARSARAAAGAGAATGGGAAGAGPVARTGGTAATGGAAAARAAAAAAHAAAASAVAGGAAAAGAAGDGAGPGATNGVGAHRTVDPASGLVTEQSASAPQAGASVAGAAPVPYDDEAT